MTDQPVLQYLKERWSDPRCIRTAFSLYQREGNPTLPRLPVLHKLIELLLTRTLQSWERARKQAVPQYLRRVCRMSAKHVMGQVQNQLSEDHAVNMTSRVMDALFFDVPDEALLNLCTHMTEAGKSAKDMDTPLAQYLNSDELSKQLLCQGQLGHEAIDSRYLQEFSFSNLYCPDFASKLQLGLPFLAPFAQPFSPMNLCTEVQRENECAADQELGALFNELCGCVDLKELEVELKEMQRDGRALSSEILAALDMPAVWALLSVLRLQWQMKVAKCFLLAYSDLTSLDVSRDRVLGPWLAGMFEDEWRCLLLPSLSGSVQQRLVQIEELYPQLCTRQQQHLVAAMKSAVNKCNLHFQYLAEGDLTRWLQELRLGLDEFQEALVSGGGSTSSGPEQTPKEEGQAEANCSGLAAQGAELEAGQQLVGNLLTSCNLSKHLLEDYLLTFLLDYKDNEHQARDSPLGSYLQKTPGLQPLLELQGDNLIRYARLVIYDSCSVAMLLTSACKDGFPSLMQTLKASNLKIKQWVKKIWASEKPEERKPEVQEVFGVDYPVTDVVPLHFLLILELSRLNEQAAKYTGPITDELIDVFDMAEPQVIALRKFVNMLHAMGEEWWPYKERCKVAKILMAKKKPWPPPIFDSMYLRKGLEEYSNTLHGSCATSFPGEEALRQLLPAMDQVIVSTPEERLSYYEDLANMVNVNMPNLKIPGPLKLPVEKGYAAVDFMDNETDTTWATMFGWILKVEDGEDCKIRWLDKTSEDTLTSLDLREVRTPWSYKKVERLPVKEHPRMRTLIAHGYVTVMQLQLCCAMMWIEVQQLKGKWAKRKQLGHTGQENLPLGLHSISGTSESLQDQEGTDAQKEFVVMKDDPGAQGTSADKEEDMPPDLEVLKYIYDPNLRGLDPYWEYKDPQKNVASSAGRRREVAGNKSNPYWSYFGPLGSDQRPVQWYPGAKRESKAMQFLNPYQVGVFINKGELVKGQKGQETALRSSTRGKGSKLHKERVEQLFGIDPTEGEYIRGHWVSNTEFAEAAKKTDEGGKAVAVEEDKGEEEEEVLIKTSRSERLRPKARGKLKTVTIKSDTEGSDVDEAEGKGRKREQQQVDEVRETRHGRKRALLNLVEGRKKQQKVEEKGGGRRLRSQVVAGSEEEEDNEGGSASGAGDGKVLSPASGAAVDETPPAQDVSPLYLAAQETVSVCSEDSSVVMLSEKSGLSGDNLVPVPDGESMQVDEISVGVSEGLQQIVESPPVVGEKQEHVSLASVKVVDGGEANAASSSAARTVYLAITTVKPLQLPQPLDVRLLEEFIERGLIPSRSELMKRKEGVVVGGRQQNESPIKVEEGQPPTTVGQTCCPTIAASSTPELGDPGLGAIGNDPLPADLGLIRTAPMQSKTPAPGWQLTSDKLLTGSYPQVMVVPETGPSGEGDIVGEEIKGGHLSPPRDFTMYSSCSPLHVKKNQEEAQVEEPEPLRQEFVPASEAPVALKTEVVNDGRTSVLPGVEFEGGQGGGSSTIPADNIIGTEGPSPEVHPVEVVSVFEGGWVAILSNGNCCQLDVFDGYNDDEVESTGVLKDRLGRWFAVFNNGARAQIRVDVPAVQGVTGPAGGTSM